MGLACRVLPHGQNWPIYLLQVSKNDASWNNLALKLHNHACSSKMDTCFFFSAWIGFPIACEGDVDGTLGCLIGKLLGCGVVYLSDWLEHDHSTLTLWHGGMAPTQVSEKPLFFMLWGFNNYVFIQFWPPTPSSGQLWTFWIMPTKIKLYTDQLPNSSC